MDPATLLQIHLMLHRFRDDSSLAAGKIIDVALNASTPVIGLWRVRGPNQDFLIADRLPDNIKLLTQNMLKESDNTAWVLEDPESRGISWIARGRSTYLGQIRHYRDNETQMHYEVTLF